MCCDMSPAFISGVQEQFPEAHLTFDRFHVIKILNNAVDQGSSYIWLRNQSSLKASQSDLLDQLTIKKRNLRTSRAHHIKLNFQEVCQQPDDLAETFLKKWYFWATHSRLKPIIDAAYTIKRHWDCSALVYIKNQQRYPGRNQ
ncbi:MAG: hypothetical protein CSA34_00150 [Desulfobulbus propionicus]|nr:MAG: hypothetical protein CSA34_00150 [Desulfobulbus propionicus]